MNYWKISNLSNKSAKLIVSLTQNQSKGLMLNPGEFCIARNTQTPVMDAQIRRNLIEVDKGFDNTKFNLEIGKVYKLTYLQELIQEQLSQDEQDITEDDKMKKAKSDALKYAEKKDSDQ